MFTSMSTRQACCLWSGQRTAIVWTAVLDLSAELEWNRAWFVVLKTVDVALSVRRQEHLDGSAIVAALVTPLTHDHLAVLQVNLAIDDLLAFGTHSPGQLVKHRISGLHDPFLAGARRLVVCAVFCLSQ